jgi:hypothetical protein
MKKRHGERRSFDYGVVIPDRRKKNELVDKYRKKLKPIIKIIK